MSVTDALGPNVDPQDCPDCTESVVCEYHRGWDDHATITLSVARELARRPRPAS